MRLAPALLAFGVTLAYAKPTVLKVAKIEPDAGDADGGTYARITGEGFLTGADGKPTAGSAKIWFGSRQGTVVRFASDTEMIVEAPGGKVGETVDVLLSFQGRGEIKLPKAFEFVQKAPVKP